MSRLFVFSMLLSLFSVSVAAQDAGTDELARREFELGKRAYEAHSWDEATARFERAYELSNRPALLYNIGQSADRARNDVKALASFEKYLELVDDSPNHKVVRARVASMRQAQKERKSEVELARLKRETREAELAAALQKEKSDGKVTKKWWFWTLIGAVVVGASLGAFFLVKNRDQGFVGGLFGEGGVVASSPWVEF